MIKKVKTVIAAQNIGAGYLYCYVHYITELICFFMLARQTGDSPFLWLCPLVYDALAFVPQSIIGYVSDKFPKISMGLIGTALTAVSVAGFWMGFLPGKYTAIILLSLGNAFIHVNGAQVTLRCSAGRLSHSAIFVAGGSFGVISGKLLADTALPYWPLIPLALTMLPFILLAEHYRREADEKSDCPCANFNYSSAKVPAALVVLLAVAIIVVRGYMGYGIPTSWKKTVFQTVMLYVAMGVGKAGGGIFADMFGVKRTAIFSAAAALPFLLLGDNYMLVSLIGVMLFSMTMSITLALLVSALKRTPGLAFGLTTIGLFLGTAPIFFFKFTTTLANCVVIAVLTALCLPTMLLIIGKDGKADGKCQNSC